MAEAETPAKTPPSVFARLKRGLFMTHTELIAKVGGAIRAKFEPDPRALEALEEALLTADVGPRDGRRARGRGPGRSGPA